MPTSVRARRPPAGAQRPANRGPRRNDGPPPARSLPRPRPRRRAARSAGGGRSGRNPRVGARPGRRPGARCWLGRRPPDWRVAGWRAAGWRAAGRCRLAAGAGGWRAWRLGALAAGCLAGGGLAPMARRAASRRIILGEPHASTVGRAADRTKHSWQRPGKARSAKLGRYRCGPGRLAVAGSFSRPGPGLRPRRPRAGDRVYQAPPMARPRVGASSSARAVESSPGPGPCTVGD